MKLADCAKILLWTAVTTAFLTSCGGGAANTGGSASSSVITASSVPGSSVMSSLSSIAVSSSRSSTSVSTSSSSSMLSSASLSSSSAVLASQSNSSSSSSLGSSSINSSSPSASSQASSLSSSSVANTVPTITTTTLPNGTFGSSYSQALVASSGNGSLVWSVASGSLPQGLSLSSTGILTGTPNLRGTSTFTVKVADSDNITGPSDEDTQALTLVINAVPLPADVAKSSSPLVIVVLGSSTAAGKNLVENGYLLSDRWPSRLEAYLQTIRPGTVIQNLAIAGTGTCGNLPTNYPIPSLCLTSNSAQSPAPYIHLMADPNANITKALSYNPNLIIVAHPGDDGIGVPQVIINMQILQDTASLAGVPIWFENAAPASSTANGQDQKRLDQRNTVNSTLGSHVLDFWPPLKLPDPSILLDPQYLTSDNTHPNAEGQRLLYEAVKIQLDL